MINKKKIFCFDIDNTICYTKKSNYHSSKPIKDMITIINSLFLNGHKIKIFTARHMGRNKDDSKKISVNVKLKTKKQLKMWGVKYHELIFGKPSYDIIVDDKSILYNKKKTIIKLKKFLI